MSKTIQQILNEKLEFKPSEWDAELLMKVSDKELLGKLKAIEQIFKERGSNPQDEAVVNAYIFLTTELKKRKLEFEHIKELEELAEKLRESLEDLEEGIRPAFGSPGGKRFLAKTIVSYIPEHKTYVEPFAGGAAVFFAKNPSEVEVLNDKDSELISAFKFMKNCTEFDIEKLKNKDWSRNKKVLFDSLKQSNPKNTVDQFHKFVITRSESYGGQGKKFAPDYRTDKLEVASRINKIKDRLKNTKIYNLDYQKIIKEFDSEGVFFYLDPPYPGSDDQFKFKINSNELAESLRNLKGKFILSINSSEEHKKLFSKFNLREIKHGNQMSSGGDASVSNSIRKELLISNFPLKQSTTWLQEGSLDKYVLDKKSEIDKIGQIIVVPNYISWTGSTLYAKKRIPNDADLVIRDEEIDQPLAIKLQRIFKKMIGTEPNLHASPKGANWRHFPLWHLALIPVSKNQFIELGEEEPGFAARFYEQEPRAASPEIRKQAEQSAKEDEIKMSRFFLSMKPTRAAKPNHRMTIDYFISLFEPEDYKAGILSSKKYDGMACEIFKSGDTVQIYSEDGEDITERLPQTIEAIKKLNRDNLILLAELELWLEGKHQPREAAAGYVHEKGTPDDSNIVANIFTKVYENKDIHKEPEFMRQDGLRKINFPQSTWSIPDVKKKLNLVPNLLSHSPEELRKHTNFVWKQVASEGNVAKKSNSIYYLDGKSKDGWIKWHGNALIYGTVLKRNETKVETVFNYDYGISQGEYPISDKDLVKIGDRRFVKVGTTFNTDEKKNEGDLIAVECETFNLIDNIKTGFTEVSAWAPRYIYLDKTEEDVPRRADTIEEVVKKAKKNRVLQKKTITKKGQTLYECSHSVWEDLEDCVNAKEYEELRGILHIKESEIIESENDFQLPSLDFIEDIQEAKRPLKQYPKNYAVILAHYRKKSVHGDFRRKQNGFLEGETIALAPAGFVTEDVDTIAKGKQWTARLLKEGKFRPDMDPNKKVVLFPKAKQPLEWLNVREVTVPPGTVGATVEGPGVFITMDEGMAYPGTQRTYFKEFFLDMKHFKKQRMVERLLGVSPEWEKKPKAPTQWQTWITEGDTPYILSVRQRRNKRDYIPKDGEKAIPPWWEEKIKSEYQWWKSGLSSKDKMKRLDLAFNDLIEREILKARPLEIKEDILQEKIGKFTLRFHWWMGAEVVRKLPAGDSRFELLIDTGKNALDRWDFSGKFYGDPTKQEETPAIRKSMNIQTPNGESFREWMKWEGSIPAKDSKLKRIKIEKEIDEGVYLADGTESKRTFAEFKQGQEAWIDQWENLYTGNKGGIAYGNPNERIPAYIEIKDTGDVEVIEETDQFVSFNFKGKQLRGYYVLRREDPKSDIWIFSKGRLPGQEFRETYTREELYFSESSTEASDIKSVNLTKANFPIDINYKNINYVIVETKNNKLLMNKK